MATEMGNFPGSFLEQHSCVIAVAILSQYASLLAAIQTHTQGTVVAIANSKDLEGQHDGTQDALCCDRL